MKPRAFPVIDPVATGENIVRLRKERGMTVRDRQSYFGFEEPQAIYKWQKGKTLPSVDNLYALGALLDVPMDDILVAAGAKSNIVMLEQQEEPCCSNRFGGRLLWIRQALENTSTIFAVPLRLRCRPRGGNPPRSVRACRRRAKSVVVIAAMSRSW